MRNSSRYEPEIGLANDFSTMMAFPIENNVLTLNGYGTVCTS
jgi:hypothetical protein